MEVRNLLAKTAIVPSEAIIAASFRSDEMLDDRQENQPRCPVSKPSS
jgi:hypothetical protein